jgi:3-deoxy-D-manno-octulosonic-acid transferase
MLMAIYSFLLGLGLLVSAPWWLWRMARSGRYREGLSERLGFVPSLVKTAVAGEQTVWLHAVSVGEVLAVERLIAELRAALGEGWVIVISTTTATGQKIARERLVGCPVFYFPLDLGFAVRAWLRVLKPRLMVLVESEFWPRHLVECERAGVPVAVVNARVSDRSFPRYMRLRRLWKPLFGKVRVFLAQGEESADRLRRIGAEAERIRVTGNLKWDYNSGGDNALAASFAAWLGSTRLIVAGSTHDGEERALIAAWPEILRDAEDTALLIAPRHPQRFEEVATMMKGSGFQYLQGSLFKACHEPILAGAILLLDTIGDLSAIYGIASAAFIGGSLAQKGGQNPLEAARFGVPVVMGPSFENFREIVGKMIAEGSLTITDEMGLAAALMEALNKRVGGPQHFEDRTGATQMTVEALLHLLGAQA